MTVLSNCFPFSISLFQPTNLFKPTSAPKSEQTQVVYGNFLPSIKRFLLVKKREQKMPCYFTVHKLDSSLELVSKLKIRDA